MKFKVTDKYGLTDEVSFMDAVLSGFGANTIKTPEQRLMEHIRTNGGQASQQPSGLPMQNPNELVNPYYMMEQPHDALAPMQMLQQYRQTGQVPQSQTTFTPFPPAAQQFMPIMRSSGSTVAPSVGGK